MTQRLSRQRANLTPTQALQRTSRGRSVAPVRPTVALPGVSSANLAELSPEQLRQQEIIDSLRPYITDDSLDLVAALESGANQGDLEQLLGSEPVDRAVAYVQASAEIADYRNEDGTINLADAIEGGISQDSLDLLIDPESVAATRVYLGARATLAPFISDDRIDVRSAYLTAIEQGNIAEVEAALAELGIDPLNLQSQGLPDQPGPGSQLTSSNPFSYDLVSARSAVKTVEDALNGIQRQREADPRFGVDPEFTRAWQENRQRLEAQLAERTARLRTVEQQFQVAQAFGAESRLLGTGEFATLTPEQRQIQLQQGISEQQATVNAALEPYRDGDTYDLGAAIAGGVSIQMLQDAGFQPNAIARGARVAALGPLRGESPAPDNIFSELLDDFDNAFTDNERPPFGDEGSRIVDEDEFERINAALDRLETAGLATRVGDDGEYLINAAEARVRGYRSDLLDAGLTDAEIAADVTALRANAASAREFRDEAARRNRAILQLNIEAPELVGRGGVVDLAGAIDAGYEELLLEAGFTERQITEALVERESFGRVSTSEGLQAINVLEDAGVYDADTGRVDLVEAVQVVPEQVLLDYGISESNIALAQQAVDSAEFPVQRQREYERLIGLPESDSGFPTSDAVAFGDPYVPELGATTPGGDDLQREAFFQIAVRDVFDPETGEYIRTEEAPREGTGLNLPQPPSAVGFSEGVAAVTDPLVESFIAQSFFTLPNSDERRQYNAVTTAYTNGELSTPEAAAELQGIFRERGLASRLASEAALVLLLAGPRGPSTPRGAIDTAPPGRPVADGGFSRPTGLSPDAPRTATTPFGGRDVPRAIPGDIPGRVPGRIPSRYGTGEIPVLPSNEGGTALLIGGEGRITTGGVTVIQRPVLRNTFGVEQPLPRGATVSIDSVGNVTILPELGATAEQEALALGRAVQLQEFVTSLPATERLAFLASVRAAVEAPEKPGTRPAPSPAPEPMPEPSPAPRPRRTPVGPPRRAPRAPDVEPKPPTPDPETDPATTPEPARPSPRPSRPFQPSWPAPAPEPTRRPTTVPVIPQPLPSTRPSPRPRPVTLPEPDTSPVMPTTLPAEPSRTTEPSRRTRRPRPFVAPQPARRPRPQPETQPQPVTEPQAVTRLEPLVQPQTLTQAESLTRLQPLAQPQALNRLQPLTQPGPVTRPEQIAKTRTGASARATKAQAATNAASGRRGNENDDEQTEELGATGRKLRTAGVDRGILDTFVDFVEGDALTIKDSPQIPESGTKRSFTRLEFGIEEPEPQTIPWGALDLRIEPDGDMEFKPRKPRKRGIRGPRL